MNKLANILIVDDTNTMRNLIKSVLINAGFKNFVEAENGIVALDKMQQEQFDLVICDWDMPKMDGLEVLAKMRLQDHHENTPFILVTAISEAKKVVTAIEKGLDDYIIKPIKPDDFIKRIGAVLA